jgi:hypothetical protein
MSALPWDEPTTYQEPEFLKPQPPIIPAAQRERLFREQARSVKAGYTPNPYRDMPTHELLDEKEFAGWSLVDVQATLGDLLEEDREPFAFTLWHARTRLDHIEKEIQRRRELLKSSGKRPDLRLNERQHIDFCKVKGLIPIEDFVERIYTSSEKDRLDKRNGRIVVRCMLNGHQDDDTPSFTVYTDQGSFHCYGCGRGGDVIDLAKHWFNQENSSYAVKHLCMTMGIEVPRTKEYIENPPDPNAVTGIAPDGSQITFDPALFKAKQRRSWR